MFGLSAAVLAVAIGGYVWSVHILWTYLLLGPLFLLALVDVLQRKQAIRRNFPIIGRLRYLLEGVRPEIQQYFVESDLNGRPFNRRKRSLIYQRSKRVRETVAFGTQMNTYEEGYEWMTHSMYAHPPESLEQDPRVLVGEGRCTQPYNLSIFNISAMSFGSLSKNAVLALSNGARMGGFAHNTGEGGVSPYHLEGGGDLIWQVGTGYFGCRSEDGNFSPEKFKATATHPNIKMIELKLSQGAKPGHGGILPAKKNTPEIAKIRGVEPGTDVLSPPFHKAFNSAEGLLKLITEMRELSGGKPVGFKLCVGSEIEFFDICKAMIKTGMRPDFIAVDGGEGGTGAAPVEFSDSLGAPLREGLSFVIDTLQGFDLRKDIRVLAAGHISCGFDLVRSLSLGADACYSARAMMMALGCIQALVCNTNTCPTGVATQDKTLAGGLDVPSKSDRVYNYHNKTVHALVELLAASGLKNPQELKREHIYHRINMHNVRRYDQLFPEMPVGCLLGQEDIPEIFRKHMLDKVV